MAERESIADPALPQVTVEEVNRILDVGRLLLSVLTTGELQEIQAFYLGKTQLSIPINQPISHEIGNTGVT